MSKPINGNMKTGALLLYVTPQNYNKVSQYKNKTYQNLKVRVTSDL